MIAVPPEDHAERQRALDARESFIVQAPAGSGKTELLVRRYLTLLAKVEAPEQILAITFTKKATAEMHLRISNALRKVKENGEPEDNPDLCALADAALANDNARNWNITANTRRLRIQTIDALCSELVRRMPWSARFGSPPEIVDTAAALYLQSAKLTLDHIEQNSDCADACEHLLTMVDADWNKAHTLLAGMLAKRDLWMRLIGPANREHLEGMWRQVVDAGLQRAADAISAELQKELVDLGAFAAEQLKDAEIESAIVFLDGVHGVHDASDTSNFLDANHNHINQWNGIAELLLTKNGDFRKTVNKNNGFPTDNKPIKQQMLALLKGLSEIPDLLDALRMVRFLPQHAFSDAQWKSIDALTRLLPVAAAELRLLFTERNQADYIELTQRAALALGQPDNPTDLALTFDYQLSHVLMDEFQDTSSAHIDLLTKLTAGWQADDGRTLFLVGDPMQSIYRFREAEVANFLEVQQFGLGTIRPKRLVLRCNFRSTPAMVNWFNKTFQTVLPPADDIINGAVSYVKASAYIANPNNDNDDDNDHDNDDDAVHVHAIVNQDSAHESARVAELIEATQRQHPEQSIAVLGRTRAHLYDIAAALRRRGVVFQAVDLMRLNDRPAIRDLVALTRALAQPADRIAWLSLLRAPWCGLNLADIAILAADHAAMIIDLLRDEQRTDDPSVATLSDEGKTRVARFTASLATAFERRGRIGIRQNVEAAWLCLGGPATVDASDLDDCQRYFDLLDEMTTNQIPITAASLATAGKNLWARGGADAQVQLLTIHKAKGLEFDHLFLPRLNGLSRGADKTLLRWRKLPKQLLIAPLPSSTETDEAFYSYLGALEKTHTHNELGRLLYVACTRARKSLHLFGSVHEGNNQSVKPSSNSLLALLWHAVEDKYIEALAADHEHAGDASDAGEENKTDSFQSQALQKIPIEWQPPALPKNIAFTSDDALNKSDASEETIEFSWATETARIAGVVIHQILQQVDIVGWQKWSRGVADEKQKTYWRNALMENGIYGQHLEIALVRVTDAIEKTRCDPRAEWLFSSEHRDIKTEWPLSGIVDGKVTHIRVDRSFIDKNGVRWIIDFKSGRHEGGDLEVFLNQEQQRHHQQMSTYAAVVGQLISHNSQPGNIQLGLYFPALCGWREWAG